MTEWDVWVRDTRHKPLVRLDAKRTVMLAFAEAGIDLVAGPILLIPPERHRGQWIFRVRFEVKFVQDVVWLRATEALEGTQFEVRGKPFLHSPPRRRTIQGGR